MLKMLRRKQGRSREEGEEGREERREKNVQCSNVQRSPAQDRTASWNSCGRKGPPFPADDGHFTIHPASFRSFSSSFFFFFHSLHDWNPEAWAESELQPKKKPAQKAARRNRLPLWRCSVFSLVFGVWCLIRWPSLIASSGDCICAPEHDYITIIFQKYINHIARLEWIYH